MDFIKKILVIREVEKGFSINDKEISGILRFERENGVASLYISIINLLGVKDGEYHIFIADANNKLFSFNLGFKAQSAKKVFEFLPCLDGGVAVGLFYIKDNLPILVAFSNEEKSSCDKTLLKKMVAEKCLENKKEKEPIVTNSPKTENDRTPYDDEAVATENYYELDLEIEKKLEHLKKKDEVFCSKNGDGDCQNQEKVQKEQEFGFTFQNEKFDDESQKLPYYKQAERELNDLFNKFPEFNDLSRYFPDSKFVKINYSSDKYYIVGIIKERGQEKYICYGVPEKYSDIPPKELDGYATFIPLSIFDLKGDGFWVIFQDAITGNAVFNKNNKK